MRERGGGVDIPSHESNKRRNHSNAKSGCSASGSVSTSQGDDRGCGQRVWIKGVRRMCQKGVNAVLVDRLYGAKGVDSKVLIVSVSIRCVRRCVNDRVMCWNDCKRVLW